MCIKCNWTNWLVLKNIRIVTGYEVRIENSVTRVTVQHYKACPVMLKSYPKWRNFQFALNNHNGFFLHTLPSTIVFFSILIILSILCWNIYIFGQEMFRLAPTYNANIGMFGGKWRQKLDIITLKRHIDVMHESRLTTPGVRQHFNALVCPFLLGRHHAKMNFYQK